MADFTIGNIGGDMSSPVTAKQAVVNPVPEMLTSIGTNLARTASSIFAKEKEKEAELGAARELASFQEKANKYATAVEQGVMTRSAANTAVRAELTSRISANPLLYKEYNDLYGKMMGSSGTANVIAEGTRKEQEIDRLSKEAASKGFFINPDAPPDQKEAQLQNYLASEQASYNLSKVQEKLSATVATDNYQQTLLKRQAKDAYTNFVGAKLPNMSAQGEVLVNAVNNGQMKVQDAVLQLRQLGAEFFNQTAGMEDIAGGDAVRNTRAVVDKQIALYEDMINGKITTDAAKSQIDMINALTEAKMMNRPKVAEMVTASRLFGHSNPALYLNQTDIITQTLADFAQTDPTSGKPKAINPMPSDPRDKEAMGGYFAFMSDAINKASAAGAGDALDEAARHFEGMFQKADGFAALTENIGDMRPLVDMLSSPAFEKVMNSDQISEQSRYKMREVLANYWVDSVASLAKENMQERIAVPAGRNATSNFSLPKGRVSLQSALERNTMQVKDLVEPVIRGGQLSFRPVNPNGPQAAIARTQRLNNTVAKLVNQATRAMAHVEGSKDYGKYLQEELLGSLGFGKEDIESEEGN